MTQCFLEGDLKDKKQDKSILCHLACSGERTKHACMDSFNIPEILESKDVSNKTGLILKPGSPCLGTLGYCDIFSKCRSVDAEGPLSRLKRFLLDPKVISQVQLWIRDYWYMFVIFVITLLVLMSIFIKVCSVHTPSSNPNKPAALKLSETLRRRNRRPIPATTIIEDERQRSAKNNKTNATTSDQPNNNHIVKYNKINNNISIK
jgi:disintegrin and metalloproteinase domain-containing protein 10